MVFSSETSCLNANLGKSPRIGKEKSSMGLSTPISRASTFQAISIHPDFFLSLYSWINNFDHFRVG